MEEIYMDIAQSSALSQAQYFPGSTALSNHSLDAITALTNKETQMTPTVTVQTSPEPPPNQFPDWFFPANSAFWTIVAITILVKVIMGYPPGSRQ